MRTALYTPQFLLPLTTPNLADQALEALKADARPRVVSPQEHDEVVRHVEFEYQALKAYPLLTWPFKPAGPDRLERAISHALERLEHPDSLNTENVTFFSGFDKPPRKPAAFGLYARAFLLRRSGEGHFDHFEVGTGAAPSENELLEMALQFTLMRESGFEIDRSVLLLSSAADLSTAPKTEDFQEHDVTLAVRELLSEAKSRIAAVRQALQGQKLEFAPQESRYRPVGTLIDRHRNFYVLKRLWDMGITDLRRVPTDLPQLRTEQIEHIEKVARGEVMIRIDYPGLAQIFAERVYPAHYPDYETGVATWPDGSTRELPFQFSNRIVSKDRRFLRHDEFIYNKSGDPRVDFAKRLVKTHSRFGGKGSIVAYSTYEKERNADLAEYLDWLAKKDESRHAYFNHLAKELRAMAPRFQDPFDYIMKFVFHSDFDAFGLKQTYPVLVKSPRATYKGQDVKTGQEARDAIIELMDVRTHPDRRTFLLKALKTYCGTDTIAPIEIDWALEDLLAAH